MTLKITNIGEITADADTLNFLAYQMLSANMDAKNETEMQKEGSKIRRQIFKEIYDALNNTGYYSK